MELEMYYYHAKNPRMRSQLVQYSLIQQLVRMDPMLYRISVALRGDQHWKVINFPTFINQFLSPKDEDEN